MGPASKTSCNTSSHHIGEVDTIVRFEPKIMVKEEMTGGNREQGRKKIVWKFRKKVPTSTENISF